MLVQCPIQTITWNIHRAIENIVNNAAADLNRIEYDMKLLF